MNAIVIEPLTPTRMNDYLRFFDHRAFTDNAKWAGCYCYFPLHDPKQTDWHQRSGPENRTAICACIANGQAQGYLAYRDGEVIGWCNAGPHALYPMVQDDKVTDAESLGLIFCFVVAPECRGQGIAARLLEAACDGLKAQGLKVVQGRPLKDSNDPAANHLGPLSMYLNAGFRVVREDSRGNVYVRKSLG
jgi:ribosomal protein S18 acetylase RimI-like enzyme